MSELDALIAAARDKVDAMTPEELRAMLHAQKRSYVISEAGFGSDADEAAYQRALDAGDTGALARLDAESRARMDFAQKHFDETYGSVDAPADGA